jgi:hypothetical protein
MNTQQVAARIVKGLIAIRGAVARLDTAHADGRTYEVRSALNTIDNEYFSMRRCIDELVDEAPPKSQ